MKRFLVFAFLFCLGNACFPLFAPSWYSASTPVSPSGLTSWSNDMAGTENDSFCTYVVTGLVADVALNDVDVGTLTNVTTGDTLETTWKFSTDGDGISQSGVQGTNQNENKGLNTFVTTNRFLGGPGVTIDYVFGDSDVEITVTSRGWNEEDKGNKSDQTEAPDAGEYEAEVVLRITF